MTHVWVLDLSSYSLFATELARFLNLNLPTDLEARADLLDNVGHELVCIAIESLDLLSHIAANADSRAAGDGDVEACNLPAGICSRLAHRVQGILFCKGALSRRFALARSGFFLQPSSAIPGVELDGSVFLRTE